MNEQLVQPPPPDPLVAETRAFWREVRREMVRDSLGTIDGAAKQVIGVASILEGLYFHAIAYSDLRGAVQGWQVALYMAPPVLLLVSLLAAVLVYFPNRYRVNVASSDAARVVYERVVRSKLLLLKAAMLSLVAGVGIVPLTVLVYLGG